MSDVIVVGVSGAPVAQRAIDWAIARAIERRQRVERVAVVGGAGGPGGEAAGVAEALAATQAMLDEHVARVASSGVEVTTRVDRGNPVPVLIEASAHAALLVIGSDYRGEGGPVRGAHGIRIAAGAKCPTVVVPDLDLGDRSGVVVGVDGSAVSEHAIGFAAAEADRLGEPLVAVAVWTPLHAPRNSTAVYPELYLANMQAATEEVLALSLAGLREDYPDLEIVRHVVQGYPSYVINDLAQNARLTVVGTHGRGAIARFLLGSISQEVIARLATVTAVVR